MSWFDRFRRQDEEFVDDRYLEPHDDEPSADGPQGTPTVGDGIGPTNSAPRGEGGPGFFSGELSTIRWISVGAAVNATKAGLDPALWSGNQMELPHEAGTLHDHEVLRDRLASQVGGAIRQTLAAMWTVASQIAVARDALREADNELIRRTKDRLRTYRLMEHNPTELGRYYRTNSRSYKNAKIALAVVLVAAEWFMTGFVIENALALSYPLLGYVIALGVTLLFVLVPHYAAIGIKEGRTSYHSWELEFRKNRDGGKHTRPGEMELHALERISETERVEDKGFVLAASSIGALLVMLLIPLSFLRAGDVNEAGWEWIPFFLFLQAAISGYFFLREWHDFGPLSHLLEQQDHRHAIAEADRLDRLEETRELEAEFLELAEDLRYNIEQAPRWDSEIVESCLATLYWGRATAHVEEPDLAPFLQLSLLPKYTTLQATGSEVDPQEDRTADAGWRHPSLLSPNRFGREWWMEHALSALQDIPVDEDEDPELARRLNQQVDSDDPWIISLAPGDLLGQFLERLFGVDAVYRSPALFDEPIPPDVSDEHGFDGVVTGTIGQTTIVNEHVTERDALLGIGDPDHHPHQDDQTSIEVNGAEVVDDTKVADIRRAGSSSQDADDGPVATGEGSGPEHPEAAEGGGESRGDGPGSSSNGSEPEEREGRVDL